MAEPKPGFNALFLRDEELRQGIELLFFSYRDFTGEADLMLEHFGFGRAHHRVIYFVGRYPGLSVSDLLNILKVRKQSLSRVLRELVDKEFIEQKPCDQDRRRRLLTLTQKGVDLERQLTQKQRQRIAAAYRAAGAQAVEGFRKVLTNIMDEPDRERFFPTDSKPDRP